MIVNFYDQWGTHEHETSVPGRAYDSSVPITCVACIAMLDSRMSVWLDKLTKRHNLPENFWNGYKFGWS